MAKILPLALGPRKRPPAAGGNEVDAGLVRRMQRGDEAALVRVMERYGPAILAYTYRIVGDRHLAEEILQDTMLKVWQHARLFRVDGHLKAWLFKVARNNAIDYKRRKRPVVEELGPTLPAQTQRPDREAERAWVATRIDAALTALPLVYREVVELRYYHQLDYQEIAEVLGIPLGTVKSRISYALKRLPRLLRDQGIDQHLLDL
ncbi:MAG: RNA polymerase sigma factor [Firmicutes bacterium]|nr:RNA polymerase sigma factor [Bacillota bacterium]